MLVSVSRLYHGAWNARKIDGFAIGHLNHQAFPDHLPDVFDPFLGTAVPSYLSLVWR